MVVRHFSIWWKISACFEIDNNNMLEKFGAGAAELTGANEKQLQEQLTTNEVT